MNKLAQIQPFDLWDFMAGHVRLTTGDLFSVLHINGRDFYFYSDGDRDRYPLGPGREIGGLDGTGSGCSPCCKEAQVAHEAGRVVREAAGIEGLQDREQELIEEAGFDRAELRDSVATKDG